MMPPLPRPLTGTSLVAEYRGARRWTDTSTIFCPRPDSNELSFTGIPHFGRHGRRGGGCFIAFKPSS
eukprot:scaffold185928_cov42-Attheya_sp.AAC.1